MPGDDVAQKAFAEMQKHRERFIKKPSQQFLDAEAEYARVMLTTRREDHGREECQKVLDAYRNAILDHMRASLEQEVKKAGRTIDDARREAIEQAAQQNTEQALTAITNPLVVAIAARSWTSKQNRPDDHGFTAGIH